MIPTSASISTIIVGQDFEDLALSASCGRAVFLAVLLGIWFGRVVGGRVSEIDRGLADFAAGKPQGRIDDHGSDEMHRIAQSRKRDGAPDVRYT